MLEVTTKLVIAKPRERVAEFAAEPDNAPKWRSRVKSVTWKTERPVTVGSRIAFEAQNSGKKGGTVFEVTMFEPGHAMKMRSIGAPYPLELIYVWEEGETAGTTNCKVISRAKPEGLNKVISPFLKGQYKSDNLADLKKLKEIVERG